MTNKAKTTAKPDAKGALKRAQQTAADAAKEKTIEATPELAQVLADEQADIDSEQVASDKGRLALADFIDETAKAEKAKPVKAAKVAKPKVKKAPGLRDLALAWLKANPNTPVSGAGIAKALGHATSSDICGKHLQKLAADPSTGVTQTSLVPRKFMYVAATEAK